jgi:WD40 repeat protein/tetratricopeptide (TPR) repeat protein
VGEFERVWKWARRRPAAAGLLVLALLSLVAGTAVSTAFGLAARRQAAAARMAAAQALASSRAAQAARDRAQAAALETSRQATRSATRSALAAAEDGEIDRGLFGLLDALQTAPDKSPEDRAFRAAIAQNLTAWQAAQPVLRHFVNRVEKARFVGPGGRELTLISGRRLRQINLVTGQAIGEPDGREFPAPILEISPDGAALLVTPRVQPGQAHEWLGLCDTATGRLRAEYRHPLDQAPTAKKPPRFGPGNRVITLSHWVSFGKSVTRCWRVDRGDVFEPLTASRAPILNPDFRLFHGRGGRAILGLIPKEDEISSRGSAGLLFWDVDAGRPIDGFEPEPGSSGPDWVFDGTALLTLVTGAKVGRVQWWDPQTGRPLRPSWRPVRALRAPRLSADGRTLIVGCDDGRVRWYDLVTGRECGIALEARVTDVAPQGAFVLGVDQDELRVWQIPGPLRPFPKDDARTLRLNFTSLDFRHDDSAILVGQNNESATMGRVMHPAVFSRGVSGDRGAQIFDVASGRPLGAPLYPSDRCSVFSRDGRFIAATRTEIMRHGVFEPTLIGVWEAARGQAVLPSMRIPYYVHTFAMSPDSDVLAAGVVQGVLLIDVATGTETRFLRQHGPISRIEYSPDGRLLAAGARPGWPDTRFSGVRIWDGATGLAVGPLWPCRQLPFFRFSPDGHVLLVLDVADRKFVRLDTATGLPTALAHHLDDAQTDQADTFSENSDINGPLKFGGIDFRPDGMALAESRVSTVARQWDMVTGRPIGPPLRHDSPVIWIEYSPDGTALACGSTDGTVRLWDAPSGQPVGPPLPHDLPLLGLKFARDGRTLIVVMTDGHSISWPVPGPITTDKPELIRAWLETTRGVRQGDGGEFLEPVSRADWLEGRSRLRSEWPSSPVPADPRAMLARWHAARAADAERGGDSHAARRHLDDLAALEADNWLLHARRARTLAAEDRLAEAGSEYSAAARLGGPEDLTAWYWRAAFDARNQNRHQAAVWYMDRVVAARRYDPMVFAQRAEMNDRLGNTAEADADRRRSLALKPDLATILDLAEERAILGDWPGALEMFEVAVERSRALKNPAPQEWPTVTHLALACLRNGDRLRYRLVCERLLAIEQEDKAFDPEKANSLAWVCVLGRGALDDPGKAVRLAQRAIAAFHSALEKGNALNTLGGALYRAGRPSEAIARLEEGIRMRGGTSAPQDWAFLAMAHQALRDNPKARTWLSRFSAIRETPFWEAVEVDLLRREAEAKVLYDPVFPADVFQRR